VPQTKEIITMKCGTVVTVEYRLPNYHEYYFSFDKTPDLTKVMFLHRYRALGDRSEYEEQARKGYIYMVVTRV
jgi:hypothetical protein